MGGGFRDGNLMGFQQLHYIVCIAIVKLSIGIAVVEEAKDWLAKVRVEIKDVFHLTESKAFLI